MRQHANYDICISHYLPPGSLAHRLAYFLALLGFMNDFFFALVGNTRWMKAQTIDIRDDIESGMMWLTYWTRVRRLVSSV